jgi:iron complex outermembrane recepter protein
VKIHKGIVMLAGVGTAFAGTANAQSSPAADDIQEITITGSRVITNGNDNPTPVTVVSVDQLLEANPTSVAQALAQLPALMANPNQGNQGAGTQAVINLRGIYGGRNLTLVDGHRQVPTSSANITTTGVDTNLIPQLLLKRVDIVTGGASAVYGSDAVTGVVNFVTDNNFNGVKVVGQAGQSTYNDDRTYNMGIAAGTSAFGGRGHVEFSYQNFNDPGIPDRFSRDWGRNVWSMQGAVPGSTAGAGSAANPWLLYNNVRFGTVNSGGVVNTGALAGLQFAQNGALSTFNTGHPTGSGGVQIGGDGGYFTTSSAFSGQNMDQLFGRLDYDFSSSVKGYAELSASRVLYWSNGTNANVRNIAIGYNNAFLTGIQPVYQAQIASYLAAHPTETSFKFSKIFNQLDAFPAPRTENTETSVTFLAGLTGSLGAFKWDLGFEHAKSANKFDSPNNYSNARLFAAINAVVNPANGQVVCNASLVNPTVYGGCVPLNLFGPTSMTRAAFDWISNPSSNTTTNVLDDVTGGITGSPFSTWAGPVDMAWSGEWRRQTYGVNSTALPTDPVSCTGIAFNCSGSTTPYQNSTANFPTAEVKVSEIAYEAQVPLLKDAFLAKTLAANAAARYTDYSTSGSIWSWKLGLTWTLSDSLAVRAARSRDIRAPTLANLFAPRSVGTSVPFADVHVYPVVNGVPQDQNATPITINQGNAKLLPEIGNTTTVGLIWTPQFIQGFSASVDYYNIKITQGINSPSPFQPATQQACEDSGGTAPVCALYVRPLPFSDHTAANKVTQINNIVVNTGGVRTSGADVEINWAHPLDGHAFKARVLFNYQPHLIYDLTPAPIVDVGGAADGVNQLAATPNMKGVLQLNYELVENFTASVQTRWRNAMIQNGNSSLKFVVNSVAPAWYTDLNLGYKLKAVGGDMDLYLNVRNLFNKPPDPWASTGGTGQIGTFGGWLQGDDPMGRYYTVGFRYKL